MSPGACADGSAVATDPGPMALKVGAPDIAAAPGLEYRRGCPAWSGINNHEGSRFTADAASLTPVAQMLAARHLFFSIPAPSPDTKVVRWRSMFGVASAEPRHFPRRHRQRRGDSASNWMRWRRVPRRQGVAIAIGHPHDLTLKVLAAWLAQNHGVTLVRLPRRCAQDRAHAGVALVPTFFARREMHAIRRILSARKRPGWGMPRAMSCLELLALLRRWQNARLLRPRPSARGPC